MKEQPAKTSDDIQKSAGENITFAEASVIPSSPNPSLIIGLALLGGLAAGIGLAHWLERSSQREGSQKLVLAAVWGMMLTEKWVLPSSAARMSLTVSDTPSTVIEPLVAI